MDGVRVLEVIFERPADFSPERYFGESFGVFTAAGAVDVRLRFTPEAAPFVRERFWHASQVLVDLEGGEVELRLHVADSVELERWVCGWMGEVEVVEPVGLRARVRGHARRLAERNA
jgi:proteasome accessory factor B